MPLFCSGALAGTGEDEKEFPDCTFMEIECLVPGGLAGLSLVHGIAAGTSVPAPLSLSRLGLGSWPAQSPGQGWGLGRRSAPNTLMESCIPLGWKGS